MFLQKTELSAELSSSLIQTDTVIKGWKKATDLWSEVKVSLWHSVDKENIQGATSEALANVSAACFSDKFWWLKYSW